LLIENTSGNFIMAWKDTVSVVSSIIGILGFIGIITGVITFCTELSKRAREKDAGRVCCDAEKMGYFAIQEPNWYKPWQYFKKHVPLPIVPEMSAIIRAGDDLAYTSALFDGIPANHDEVCWLPIYEGFFNELAWSKESSYWKRLSKDDSMKRYTKEAADHVAKLKEMSENEVFKERIKAKEEIVAEKAKEEEKAKQEEKAKGKEKANEKETVEKKMKPDTVQSQNAGAGDDACEDKQARDVVIESGDDLEKQPLMDHQSQDTQNTWVKWLRRFKQLRWIKRWRGIRDGNKDVDLKNQAQENSYLDRHVLYGLDFPDGPHLWNCVRHLDRKEPKSEVEDTDKVWIYNKKPCVETSNYDLTALSLMLGMRLRDGRDRSTKIGYGASGMSMISQHAHGFGQLHFAYSSDFEDVVEKPMGSGYSMLFAKHIACGGLPFGLYSGMTTTLMINEAVSKEVIQQGRFIVCDADPTANDMAVTALFRMPSSRYVSLQFPCTKNHDKGKKDIFGKIVWFPQAGGPQKDSQRWCEAVAGIAFGGLVPQATADLADAVGFTALGGLKWDQDQSFEALHELVLAVHQRAMSRKGSENGDDSDSARLTKKLRKRFHLFGLYRKRGTKNIQHSTSIFDPYLGFSRNQLDTRTAARVFSCYMTLLECATAQYYHTEPYKFAKPEYLPKQPTMDPKSHVPKSPVEKVFQACWKELEVGYRRAVGAEPSPSPPLQNASNNAEGQMAENKQGEIEFRRGPLSTANIEEVERPNEGDKPIASQDKPALDSNDSNPSPKETKLGDFSEEIWKLVYYINGKKYDGNKSDENKSDENKSDENKSDENKSDENKSDENKLDDNKSDDNKSDENKLDENEPDGNEPDGNEPDGNESDGTEPDDDGFKDETITGNKVEENFPLNDEKCGTIARIIIVAWAHQVQFIEWNAKKARKNSDRYYMPSPDSFPDISALGGI
jgi:hypothetical protein